MNKKPKAIAMAPVANSSQIEAIGHCPATNTLSVKFKAGGTTYHYHDVTAEKHQQMLKADSLGKFLGSNVKPNHKFTKVD